MSYVIAFTVLALIVLYVVLGRIRPQQSARREGKRVELPGDGRDIPAENEGSEFASHHPSEPAQPDWGTVANDSDAARNGNRQERRS